jgi:hypothetical protein
MSALVKFVKDPDETKRYAITWEDWLDTGELLESAMFETGVDSGPSDASPLIVDSYALTQDLLGVVFFISSGQAGVIYKVTVRVHTDGGQIKEDCVLIAVRNC